MTATNAPPATGSVPPRKGGRKRNAWIAAISAASDTQNVKTASMVFTVANPLDFALAVPAVTNLSIVV